MKILYLHGLYSKPGGKKPSYLLARGHEVVNPGMPDEDFAESVRIAQEAFEACRPDVVVGSSRGGAVAVNLAVGATPVVLIAPAWRKWGDATYATPATVVIHSEHDAVIPLEHSRQLVTVSGLPSTALVVAGADHNMVDPAAYAALDGALAAIEAVGRNGRSADFLK